MTERQFPPFVYAPVEFESEQPDLPRLRMHPTPGGMAVFVYSALDRFESLYGGGPDQAWVVTDLEALNAAHESHPFDVLILDGAAQSDPATEPSDATSDRSEASDEDADGAPRGIFLAGSTPAGETR